MAGVSWSFRSEVTSVVPCEKLGAQCLLAFSGTAHPFSRLGRLQSFDRSFGNGSLLHLQPSTRHSAFGQDAPKTRSWRLATFRTFGGPGRTGSSRLNTDIAESVSFDRFQKASVSRVHPGYQEADLLSVRDGSTAASSLEVYPKQTGPIGRAAWDEVRSPAKPSRAIAAVKGRMVFRKAPCAAPAVPTVTTFRRPTSSAVHAASVVSDG